MDLKLNDVFKGIKDSLKGHPLHDQCFYETASSNKRFWILDEDKGKSSPKIFLVISKSKVPTLTQNICVLIATNSNESKIREQFRNSIDPAEWEIENGIRLESLKECFLFKKSDHGYNSLEDAVRDLTAFLIEAYDRTLSVFQDRKKEFIRNNEKPQMNTNKAPNFPLNQILFGPPGTGKTYHTINRALEIIDPKFYLENQENREALQKRFKELLIQDWEKDSGQIAFCTFHQSMSYEDFVEGIKPVLPKDESDSELVGDRVSYRIESGIFKKLCQAAKLPPTEGFNFDLVWEQFYQSLTSETIFKSTESELTFEQEVSNINSIKVRFTTSYDPEEEKGKRVFTVTKNVARRLFEAGIAFNIPIRKWIAVRDVVGAGRATTSLAVYKSFWDFAFQKGYFNKGPQLVKNYVLIIDEINRGNVSQIFGELITLIESDKRAGMPESLEVILPYSKEPFSVPSNLYIIGTMNTADRSVEALDTALRRRFIFEEKGPESTLLSPVRMFWKLLWDYKDVKWEQEPYFSKETSIYNLFGPGQRNWEERKKIWDQHFEKKEQDFSKQGPLLEGFFDPNGLNLEKLLNTINSRIELLLSKDHQIGHSYFMKVYSEEDLKMAFYKSIIPLLQEYFFGDYGKIGLVLGNGFVETVASPNPFANFDYEASDTLSERIIYRITDYRDEGKDGFLKAVMSIYT